MSPEGEGVPNPYAMRVNPYDLSTWRDRGSADGGSAGDEADGAADGVPGGAASSARSAPLSGDWRTDPAFAVEVGDDSDRRGADDDSAGQGWPAASGRTDDRRRGGSTADDGTWHRAPDDPDALAAPDEADYDPPPLPRDLVDPFELARRVVNQSRAAARDRGAFPISAKTQMREARDRSASAPGYSGARPDPRDPQGVEAVLRRVLGNLGWNEGMSSGRVLEEWDTIVGEQIAAHCRPVSLDAGVLVVSADSSAWASQMRMISSQLITRVHEHVGASVISELTVTGPAARSWKKGRRTVTWRGPRDTYG